MKKISFLLLLSILLPLLSQLSLLPSSAAGFYTVSVTDGKSGALTDPSVRNYWNPASADSKVTLTLKDGAITDGIYINWYAPQSEFVLTATDGEGRIVTSYKNGDRYDGYSCFYPLDEATRKVEIAMPAKGSDYGIAYLELSEKGEDSSSIMKWQDPAQNCDLLVVATHQDDEYIFLGGVIPKYLDAGYSVSLAYTATCARTRVTEGLNGLWTAGIRNYPDFVGYLDKGRPNSFEEGLEAWGGLDAVVTSYVRVLRMRKPVVVVTHDENGENYHNHHKITAAALKQAVVSAADPSYDPESAERYGVWQVSKLYLHLYRKNQVHLSYAEPLESYGGRTAYEVAADAYDCHPSQHASYMLDWSAIQPGAKYDNRLFGCYFSTVGYDDVDLFYNTPIYRGGTNPPEDQTDPPTPPASSSTDPVRTDPPQTSTDPVKTDPPETSSEPIKTDPPETSSEPIQTDPPETSSGPIKTEPTAPPSDPTGTTARPPQTDPPGTESQGTTPAAGATVQRPVTTRVPPAGTTAGTGSSASRRPDGDRPILPLLIGLCVAAAAAIAGVVIALVLRRNRRGM